MGDERYFHGGVPGLSPGDTIRPPAEPGVSVSTTHPEQRGGSARPRVAPAELAGAGELVVTAAGNPACLGCGKPLAEQKDSEYHNDRPFKRSRVDIPSGRYGYGGQGRFCTLRCGYSCAVRQVGGALPPMLDLDREASCGCTVRELRAGGHREVCYYAAPDPERQRQRELADRVEAATGRSHLSPGERRDG